jgi:hypothetical protein
MRADPLIPQDPLVLTKQFSNRIALGYANADPTLATKASVNAVPQLTATQTLSTLTL